MKIKTLGDLEKAYYKKHPRRLTQKQLDAREEASHTEYIRDKKKESRKNKEK